MEENKYICPKCGEAMKAVYEKPALNLVCPKCGCNIATTKWDDIDLDDTDYGIILKSSQSVTIEQIKCISIMSGQNFITSKKLLENGGLLFKLKAIDIKSKCIQLDKNHISYSISPDFPY